MLRARAKILNFKASARRNNPSPNESGRDYVARALGVTLAPRIMSGLPTNPEQESAGEALLPPRLSSSYAVLVPDLMCLDLRGGRLVEGVYRLLAKLYHPLFA